MQCLKVPVFRSVFQIEIICFLSVVPVVGLKAEPRWAIMKGCPAGLEAERSLATISVVKECN